MRQPYNTLPVLRDTLSLQLILNWNSKLEQCIMKNAKWMNEWMNWSKHI